MEAILLTHFLYMILDSKKTTRSQFSVPDLRDIHRNLKQEKNFNSRESFFRKSPFCTFSCINPGFGGPWDMLAIFLVNVFCFNGRIEPFPDKLNLIFADILVNVIFIMVPS